MNKLFLIGNGFDLAHGLKTKYSDFILWYLNQTITKAGKSASFEDKLIKITAGRYFNFNRFSSINELLSTAKANGISITFKHVFFRSIIEQTTEFNWVDIESKYYSNIIFIYRKLEKLERDNHKSIDKDLIELNDCFDFLKELLIEYLLTIKIEPKDKKDEIMNHFITELTTRKQKTVKDRVLFLNFNYTSTIEQYSSLPSSVSSEINYIHGKLNDSDNPIIFGYGDEMDLYYEKIERLNTNEFLRNFKSFSYFKTKNYQNLTSFIESESFNVFIMGHSCGLSDRILLNSIFEHINCKKIKIYYFQKSESENDFFEKTQEISRHFKSNSKNKMRNSIIPFSECLPLIKTNS